MNQSPNKPYFPNLMESVFGQFGLGTEKDETNTDFRANGLLTLGAELELQIVDAETFALTSKAEDLLKALKTQPKIKPELYLDMIEINTGICQDANEVESDLGKSLDLLAAEGEKSALLLPARGRTPPRVTRIRTSIRQNATTT